MANLHVTLIVRKRMSAGSQRRAGLAASRFRRLSLGVR
jgi:hypothetical protein